MTTQSWPPPLNETPEWYKQAWFTVLTLFFCFPIGLALMWVYQNKWHVAVKSIISGLYALFLIGFIGSVNDYSSKSASLPTPVTPATSVHLTPAQKQEAAKTAREQAAQGKKAAQHQKAEDAKAAAVTKRQEKENERKQAEEARQEEKEAQRQAEYDRTHYKSDGLTLDTKSVHWAEDDSGFASYITGKVTNDTGDDVDYAEITYKELDKEGNQIGTARDNITHLAAGTTWKFKCTILEDGTKHIELDQLKTTPF